MRSDAAVLRGGRDQTCVQMAAVEDASARAAAEDRSSVEAAHYFCNAQKGSKTGQNSPKTGKKGAKVNCMPQIRDGEW